MLKPPVHGVKRLDSDISSSVGMANPLKRQAEMAGLIQNDAVRRDGKGKDNGDGDDDQSGLSETRDKAKDWSLLTASTPAGVTTANGVANANGANTTSTSTLNVNIHANANATPNPNSEPHDGTSWLLTQVSRMDSALREATFQRALILRYHAEIRQQNINNLYPRTPMIMRDRYLKACREWSEVSERVRFYMEKCRKTYRPPDLTAEVAAVSMAQAVGEVVKSEKKEMDMEMEVKLGRDENGGDAQHAIDIDDSSSPIIKSSVVAVNGAEPIVIDDDDNAENEDGIDSDWDPNRPKPKRRMKAPKFEPGSLPSSIMKIDTAHNGSASAHAMGTPVGGVKLGPGIGGGSGSGDGSFMPHSGLSTIDMQASSSTGGAVATSVAQSQPIVIDGANNANGSTLRNGNGANHGQVGVGLNGNGSTEAQAQATGGAQDLFGLGDFFDFDMTMENPIGAEDELNPTATVDSTPSQLLKDIENVVAATTTSAAVEAGENLSSGNVQNMIDALGNPSVTVDVTTPAGDSSAAAFNGFSAQAPQETNVGTATAQSSLPAPASERQTGPSPISGVHALQTQPQHEKADQHPDAAPPPTDTDTQMDDNATPGYLELPPGDVDFTNLDLSEYSELFGFGDMNGMGGDSMGGSPNGGGMNYTNMGNGLDNNLSYMDTGST